MKKKILLIGPMPPPFGGVSSHVERLSAKINSTNDLEAAVFDPGKMKFYDPTGAGRNLFQAIRFFASTAIVHLHISHRLKIFIAKISNLVGKKVVYTQHNVRDQNSSSVVKLHSIADAAIQVYSSPSNFLDHKTHIIPAFIPASSVSIIGSDIGKELSDYKNVIVAIATHPKNKTVQIDGKDIYGFDLMLDAYSKISRKGMILVLIDSNGSSREDYQSEIQKINTAGQPVKYISSTTDFNALLQLCSVYVRPTRSDGDSIAIREALAAGVKVLASDCVIRPEGVALFNNNDPRSLEMELNKLLDVPNSPPFVQNDFSGQVLELYRAIS